MAPKSFIVTGLIVVVLVMAAPAVDAQSGGIMGPFPGLIHIYGMVPCSQNMSVAVSGTQTPVFPNAVVQLTCNDGNIISTATTNAAGIFSIALNPADFILSNIINCHLVVPTALSTCNSALPATGVLQSGMKFVGNFLMGLLNIANITPTGFQFFNIA